ncbi:type II and III secretion system protein family protein [Halocynthiibacter sp. C4]|uniref:type II and III secretion system protein family protein n=1 Tax=Halocynthiibacter sp. C4 TaxID=2992758 RepID=UPI00237B3D43|nr:type II and III secretion system protein family protein [Halocynthiibacter sp. C4]MDE0588707.1 type II and III secretion system protein family protein [Halocynthiibacter sp. C4]
MIIRNILSAAALGAALTFAVAPSATHAETLKVLRGATSTALSVPMNRAVVVESETPFAELSIANPGIADISTLSDRTIYVLGKAPGRTTLTLLGADGGLLTNVEVHVTPDIAEFKERLRQILPNEKIEVRTANDGIVLSGTISSIARMDRALDLAQRYAPDRVSNLMVVGGNHQVLLKVKFAEMQRSVRKSLSSSIGVSSLLGDPTVVGGAGNYAESALLNNALNNNSTLSANERNGAMLFGFNAGGTQVAIMLEALESKGAVRTLAEPNLTALSGQEAKFLAGGEYPVPVAQNNSGGGTTTTVEFKPFGIELNFIPRVVDGDVINLTLDAAVSSLDPTNGITASGFQIDAFRRRETSTTVEMRDGESFAIAGLLQDDFRDLNSQVPWLGDIPVLGALFRSAEYEREQSELVIIITPHLVTPTRGEALALPTDRIRPPSETELFLFGNVLEDKKPQGVAGEVAKQDFGGSFGYVME